MSTGTDVINFVQSTPSAIGYIDEADLKPGLSVLLRRCELRGQRCLAARSAAWIVFRLVWQGLGVAGLPGAFHIGV